MSSYALDSACHLHFTSHLLTNMSSIQQSRAATRHLTQRKDAIFAPVLKHAVRCPLTHAPALQDTSLWHQQLQGQSSLSRRILCRSQLPDKTSGSPGGGSGNDGNNNLAYTLGMGALWIGLTAYAFVLSPNQTPYRDQIFLKLLVGIKDADETFVVNQVFTALFNVMGVWPAIFACLLIPAGRSENKLPAWPFVTTSFAFGVFGLLPYFTFWKPDTNQQLPPPKEELEGWNRLFMKGAETAVLPAVLLAAAAYQVFLAATAGGESWADFIRLFDESRLVHVTTLDFMCLTAFAPFWMYNDAEGRKWAQRDTLLPILSFLPVVGPAIYLLLRPKTDMSA